MFYIINILISYLFQKPHYSFMLSEHNENWVESNTLLCSSKKKTKKWKKQLSLIYRSFYSDYIKSTQMEFASCNNETTAFFKYQL